MKTQLEVNELSSQKIHKHTKAELVLYESDAAGMIVYKEAGRYRVHKILSRDTYTNTERHDISYVYHSHDGVLRCSCTRYDDCIHCDAVRKALRSDAIVSHVKTRPVAEGVLAVDVDNHTSEIRPKVYVDAFVTRHLCIRQY